MNTANDRRFEDLRMRAQEMMNGLDGKIHPEHSREGREVMGLIKELEVHQVELEIQNQELRETQEELTELQSQYHDIYEFAPCGYVTLNKDKIITRANLTFAILVDRERRNLIGKSFISLISHPDDSNFREALGTVRNGEDQNLIIKLKVNTKLPLWARTDIRAQRNESGETDQYLVTLVDITAQIKAEKTLADRTREVEKLLKEKELLMRESNHRIKNDIHVIGSFLELQILSAPNEETREGLMKAQNMVNTMNKIYENLSKKDDITRINAGKLLQEVIDDITRLILPEHTEIEASLSNIMVSSKASVSLGLILNEILTNAAKYAVPAVENPAIRVILRQDRKGLGELIISDNGPGIPESVQELTNIGSGLGLARALTQQLNGELFARNSNGTEVTVRFACEN